VNRGRERKPGRTEDPWIEEDQSGILRVRYRVADRLFRTRSEHQRVEIVETTGFGRMLVNDGVVMLSERDERVYHEMIVHVPMFVGPCIRRVLVVGGGDGGTVREVLRHPSVTSCTLVEIDAAVVDACRRFLPQTAAGLDDPRVELRIEDGVSYVARTRERYDLVLVDSSDPVGPAKPLFGAGFYENVRRILSDDGIVVSQAESPFYESSAQRALLQVLHGLFPRVQIYNYSNLTYPGGLWSFSFACRDDLCPVGDFDEGRVEQSGLSFHYYSAAVHRAAFALPAFQLEAVGHLLTPPKPHGPAVTG
jgi:spermidine synthase